jgi:GT2 family glycosyltransferase
LIRRVTVIIPAANEEHQIGRCLSAVAAARRHLHRTSAAIAVRTLVVLDGCQDRTAAIAASCGAQTVTITAGNVGMARAAGASAALAGGGPPSELWLASSDADSRVPATWLTAMMTEARLGAHLVLGTVTPDRCLEPRARAEWLSRHYLRDGHPHVHGANLGIRGDSYLSLGGWPQLATGEDTELARRAARAGHLRICRTGSIPVVTSVRPDGRAPRGFSSYLHQISVTTAQAKDMTGPAPAALARPELPATAGAQRRTRPGLVPLPAPERR